MAKRKQLTWRGLLELCAEHGKDQVIAVLEQQNSALENLQAAYYAEPDSIPQAQRLTDTITRQCATIGRLRGMSESEIRAALK
jgi:hypothetical protein